MKRINRVFAFVHVFPWTVYAGAILWGIMYCGNAFVPNIYLGVLLTGLYVFYTHFYLLTKFLTKGRYKGYFLRLIPIVSTAPLLFMVFIDMHDPFYQREWFGMALGTLAAFLALSLLIRIGQNVIINTLKQEEVKKQAINTELVYLKSQINPHFLFNTLNNIHTLVYNQAPAAPEAVMRLSSLMRYMIYESNALTVPLSVEIGYLQDYISLQQLRYEHSPIVDFRVEGDPETCHIAPLLFIHILENAYKHSPNRLEPGAIRVRLAVWEGVLTATFQNPIGSRRKDLLNEPSGIGLPNVQKRLQLLYPNQHSLDISKTDGVFAVELTITNFQAKGNEREANLLYH
jgi:sensor histidine kinase YesM